MRTPPILIVLMVLILGFAFLLELVTQPKGVNGIGLQPVLTVLLLVLVALLFAGALLIYRRKGMSTKAWYVHFGISIFLLLLFALLGFLGRFHPFYALVVVPIVSSGLRLAQRERPRTR